MNETTRKRRQQADTVGPIYVAIIVTATNVMAVELRDGAATYNVVDRCRPMLNRINSVGYLRFRFAALLSSLH